MEKERKKISLATYVVSLIIMVAIIVGIIYCMINQESTLIKAEEHNISQDNVEIEKSNINYYTYSENGDEAQEIALILIQRTENEGVFIFENAEIYDSGSHSNEIGGFYKISDSKIELSHNTSDEDEYNLFQNSFDFTGVKMKQDDEEEYSKYVFEYNENKIVLGDKTLTLGKNDNSKGTLYKDEKESYLIYLIETSNDEGFFTFVNIDKMSIDEIGGYYNVNESSLKLSHITNEEDEYNLFKNIFDFTGVKMEQDEEEGYSKYIFEYKNNNIILGNTMLTEVIY